MNKTITVSIPTMKCAGCVSAIEKVLSDEAAVVNASIDLAAKTAEIETSLSPIALAGVIKTAGFEVATMTIDNEAI